MSPPGADTCGSRSRLGFCFVCVSRGQVKQTDGEREREVDRQVDRQVDKRQCGLTPKRQGHSVGVTVVAADCSGTLDHTGVTVDCLLFLGYKIILLQ